MTLKERWKDFKYRFKIFMWYLITEPWRQLMEIMDVFYKVAVSLNKTLTWTYVAIIFMVISLFMGKRFVAGIFLLFLLFTILLWEWERGFFIHRHRQATKERIMKEAKKNGTIDQYGERDDGSKNGKISEQRRRDN